MANGYKNNKSAVMTRVSDSGSLYRSLRPRYNTIQYNIRLLEAVRMQRRTIIEREKYVENENVKMVHNE